MRGRWEDRFDLVQVDEMQDTHLAEYLVLRTLAYQTQSVVLAGDFDQTIYEWRGSEPDKVLEQFWHDFPGAVEFQLTENHRATRALLAAATSVSARFSTRPSPRPALQLPDGSPPVAHLSPNDTAEAEWIAWRLERLHSEQAAAGEPLRWQQVGILVRPNKRALRIAQALERAGIPHLTVETFEFFRRQEVKDALAYLRFLLNPYDGHALARMLLRPARGIGEATLARIAEAEPHGLRLVDLADLATLEAGDPFCRLLEAYQQGNVVVIDTETTGLDPGVDEVIEIAARRAGAGLAGAPAQARHFHRYLRATRPVGASQAVHGFTDEFLAEHGQPPAAVLQEFRRIVAGSVVVGHNVTFDRRMLAAYSSRLGVPLELSRFADTYEIARRLLGGSDLSLEALCARLGTHARPTHRAEDDVQATVELLAKLQPLVAAGAAARRAVVSRLRPQFEPLAQEIASLRQEAARVRPPVLLDQVLERSGLRRHYAGEAKRIANLEELRRVFLERDDPAADPLASLESLLSFAALARNVDRIGPNDDRVRVLTVHQAKGLEFDVVVVAGLSENEFPNYPSLEQGREREELRLFYVAVTRARRHLILTGHAHCDGKRRKPSRYLRYLAGHMVEEGSRVLAG